MGGSTGGGVSSLSMIVRENGGEVSLSVNNVAMYAANFACWMDKTLDGALVSITAAPSTPAGSNPGDNNVAFELHLGGPIEYVEIGGELVYIDHICLQYAGSNDGGGQRWNPETMEAPVVITETLAGDRTRLRP